MLPITPTKTTTRSA